MLKIFQNVLRNVLIPVPTRVSNAFNFYGQTLARYSTNNDNANIDNSLTAQEKQSSYAGGCSGTLCPSTDPKVGEAFEKWNRSQNHAAKILKERQELKKLESQR